MTIEEKWQDYLTRVIPKSAGSVQISESRAAFFAGALSAFNLVTNLPDNEDEAVERMDTIYAELTGAFVARH